MKRVWRTLLIKEYIKWRIEGRPADCRAKYHPYWWTEPVPWFTPIFYKEGALRAIRLKNPQRNRICSLDRGQKQWWIKTGLNQGYGTWRY